MADYNLLVDKLNTDTERAEVEEEALELKAENETVRAIYTTMKVVKIA